MVLIDTSVWISHFKKRNSSLVEILSNGMAACHPFIIGELACGRLNNREEIISLMQKLFQAEEASHEELLQFIETHDLMGMGIGLIDVHLLASTLLTGISLWTYDKKLQTAAGKLGVFYVQE